MSCSHPRGLIGSVIKPQDVPELVEGAATPAKPSYGEILKSSALVGFSTLINLVIGQIRIKAMAVWLGPTGFGLMGLYGSIADIAQSIAGMGINGSGVRQIAEAVGAGDTERIARAVVVLRRSAVLLGALGATLLIAFSRPVSTFTFGSDQHAAAVKLLSVTVFFTCLSGSQVALLRGMRRISDLVKIGILGASSGAVISLPIVYALREDGIVPSLICGAAVSSIVSWWYSRKIRVRVPSLTIAEIGREAGALLKFGFALMASGLMMTGASFAIRVFVLRKLGFEAAGFYQSAWTLGGMYVGVICGTMGADFVPRLTAAAKDNVMCNRLVNEQIQMGIPLAAPGVIATLTLAPFVITLFYSAKFQQAVDVLRWLCLGMALRVISWPMGCIIIAKAARNLFFWSELGWTVVYVVLAWVCITAFALDGAGIAYCASYVLHVLMTYLIVRRLSGFRYSADNIKTGLLFVSILVFVFCGFYGLVQRVAMVVGILVLTATSIYSIRQILSLVSSTHIAPALLSILVRLRLVQRAT
jgi:enterobacterial common antigen flippase